MSDASTSVPTAVAALGLVGEFSVARRTGRRELGGALFSAAGAWCAREWYRARGPATAAGLGAVYVAAMGGSHPLSELDRLCFRVSLPLLKYFLIAPQVPAGSHLTVSLMREAVGSNSQRQDVSLPLGI